MTDHERGVLVARAEAAEACVRQENMLHLIAVDRAERAEAEAERLRGLLETVRGLVETDVICDESHRGRAVRRALLMDIRDALTAPAPTAPANDDALPTLSSLKGIAPDAGGGPDVPSEQFIAGLRAEWDVPAPAAHGQVTALDREALGRVAAMALNESQVRAGASKGVAANYDNWPDSWQEEFRVMAEAVARAVMAQQPAQDEQVVALVEQAEDVRFLAMVNLTSAALTFAAADAAWRAGTRKDTCKELNALCDEAVSFAEAHDPAPRAAATPAAHAGTGGDDA